MALEAISTGPSQQLEFADKIAIVMPVYNEGSSIEKTILEINEDLMGRLPNAKILIFEDGSRDNTKEVLSSLANRFHWVRPYTNHHRKGYPKAVKDAFKSIDENEFEYVLFLDSDGQYDPKDFFKLLKIMKDKNPDIVMGKRTNRAEPFYRVALSSGLKILERVMFDPPCKDVTSAFRLMKTRVAKYIASKVKYSTYNFWLEFTARASEEGCSVVEVDVPYRKRDGKSNVYKLSKMPKVVLKESLALAKVWWEYKGSQALKFAGVGLSGALVILAITYLLTTLLSQNYLFSTGVAIEISIVWAFLLNDRLTFKYANKSFSKSLRLIRYNLVSLGGLAINELILFSFTKFLSVFYLLSEIIAIVVTFAFNYLASTKWAWAKNR
jgi:dolichol-phosphate mannosyltransferase